MNTTVLMRSRMLIAFMSIPRSGHSSLHAKPGSREDSQARGLHYNDAPVNVQQRLALENAMLPPARREEKVLFNHKQIAPVGHP